MSLSQLMLLVHIGHLAHWHSHCAHAPGRDRDGQNYRRLQGLANGGIDGKLLAVIGGNHLGIGLMERHFLGPFGSHLAWHKYSACVIRPKRPVPSAALHP